MLKYRLIMALILIPLILLAIWFLPAIYFAVLMAIVIMSGAWEWSKLIGFDGPFLRLLYVITVLLGLVLVYWLPAEPILTIGLIAVLWAGAAISRYNRDLTPFGFQYAAVRLLMGFFILIPAWVGFIILKTSSLLGPAWLIFVLFLIWATDTGAYFAGRLWGKHPLASRVSPKKTWEGFWGGLILGVVISIVGSLWLPVSSGQRLSLIILATIAVLFAVVGDLVVSLLKRISGVKDSGQLIPGHGGILDRLDSVTAAVIVFALGSLLLGS